MGKNAASSIEKAKFCKKIFCCCKIVLKSLDPVLEPELEPETEPEPEPKLFQRRKRNCNKSIRFHTANRTV
jgi:hypothetical protein